MTTEPTTLGLRAPLEGQEPPLLVNVKGLCKHYPPPGPMRAQRLFARFRGLQLEELIADVVDDEDEELLDEEEPDELQDGVPGRDVIRKVSFGAPAGSCVAIVGPRGAGKSVLLKAIAGLIPPTRGKVVVRGVVAPALTAVARALPTKGHTFGTALPYMATIAGLPSSAVRSRMREIAEFVELPGLASMPTGAIDNRRKGEVVLAAMLCVRPDVLLTDIPVPRTPFGDRCLERVDALRAHGGVVVMEARDLRKTALVPDRVVRLQRGRVVVERAAAE